MVAFVGVQPERRCDGLHDVRAGPNPAALLEPGVPGEADAGELGDLLAAEARRSATPSGRQADVLRREASPAGPEEVGELMPASGGTFELARPGRFGDVAPGHPLGRRRPVGRRRHVGRPMSERWPNPAGRDGLIDRAHATSMPHS